MSKTKDLDRISLLPDSLLHDILSFLNTKQVVQTCVLSSRWRSVWYHIPTLNFDFDSYPFVVSTRNDPNGKEKSFKRFIFKVMSEHRCGCIEKLSYSSPSFHGVDVVALSICYAQCRDVRELYITADSIGSKMWCLSACKFLTVLKVSQGLVSYDLGSLVLPRLRILVIERSWKKPRYDDDDNDYVGSGDKDDYYDYYDGGDYGREQQLNEKTFSGCPNLECLTLINYDYLESACISAPRLESLEISASSQWELTFPKVKLCTPNLKRAKFNNVLPFLRYTNSHLACIEEVNIAVDDHDFKRHGPRRTKMGINITRLLKVFDNATSITLPCDATEVIFKGAARPLSGYYNLRHLKFKSEETKEMIDFPFDLKSIWYFMECPNLETLAVDSRIATSFTQDLQEMLPYLSDQRQVFCKLSGLDLLNDWRGRTSFFL